jgi:tungstate transport system substrate-binding protein
MIHNRIPGMAIRMNQSQHLAGRGATSLSWRAIMLACLALAAEPATTKSTAAEQPAVRCAVIGGMIDTGLWQAVSERFQKATDIGVEIVVTGPKHPIATAFRKGDIDLITMHASDTIINLVADGLAADPQPWARNDLLLVGPAADPAKIKGDTDAVAAFKKIIESRSTLLLHASLGANEVVHDILSEGDLELDADHTISLPSDKHRQLLKRAAKENAYALVGRIPFLNGKIGNEGLQIMVQGDPRMRRPYVVAVRSAPADSRQQAACKLAAFLRSPETQAWLGDFGRGELDGGPLFFPVVLPKDAARP